MLINELINSLADRVRAGTDRETSLQMLVREALPLLDDGNYDNVEVLFICATVAIRCELYGLAIQLLRRVLHHNPASSDAWCNLGNCYRREYALPQAMDAFQRALRLAIVPEYYSNLASCCINEGCPEKGLEYIIKAREIEDKPAFRWNHALLLLEQGQWEEGFKLYDAGIESGDRNPKQYEKNPADELPYWDGVDTKARLLIFAEQGMGDQILFASALSYLCWRMKSVVFYDGHPRMERLFRHSFARLIEGGRLIVHGTWKDGEVPAWYRRDDFDAKVAIGSLMQYWWLSLIQEPQSYLSADMGYRDKLMGMGLKPPFIGFGWRGGSKGTASKYRSWKLGDMRALFDLPATFISFQYTPEAAEKVARLGLPNVVHLDEIVRADDYMETARLMADMDYAVMPCTAAVHLAGAMGKYIDVCVPPERAWRYPQADWMPWYFGVGQLNRSKDMSWQQFFTSKMDYFRKRICQR